MAPKGAHKHPAGRKGGHGAGKGKGGGAGGTGSAAPAVGAMASAVVQKKAVGGVSAGMEARVRNLLQASLGRREGKLHWVTGDTV